jgi:hypothetical protein
MHGPGRLVVGYRSDAHLDPAPTEAARTGACVGVTDHRDAQRERAPGGVRELTSAKVVEGTPHNRDGPERGHCATSDGAGSRGRVQQPKIYVPTKTVKTRTARTT